MEYIMKVQKIVAVIFVHLFAKYPTDLYVPGSVPQPLLLFLWGSQSKATPAGGHGGARL